MSRAKKTIKTKKPARKQASQMLDASRSSRKPYTYIAYNQYNQDHDTNVNEWDLALVRSRSRDLFNNTPAVRSAISEMAWMSVSDGWLLKSNSTDLQYKKEVQDFINKSWIPITGFRKLLIAIVKTYLRDGDCLVYLTTYPNGKYPKIKVVPAHKIQNGRHNGVVIDGPYTGLTISKGVIINEIGEPVAYNIVNPNGKDIQISIRNSQLVLENDDVDQFRGIPALRDSVLYWEDIRAIQSFETQGIKSAASKALIINAPQQQAEALATDVNNPLVNEVPILSPDGTTKEIKEKELRGGEVIIFDNSKGNGEIKQIDTTRPTQNVQEFLKEMVRLAMVGLRWPMEFSTHLDMGGATAKTVFPKVQERINEIQQMVILPIWNRIMLYVIAKATKEGYLSKSDDWMKIEPTYPGEFAYEQLKDVKSDIELLKLGIISPQYVAEKYGFIDYEGLEGKYRWLLKAKELSKSTEPIKSSDLVQLWPNQQPASAIIKTDTEETK